MVLGGVVGVVRVVVHAAGKKLGTVGAAAATFPGSPVRTPPARASTGPSVTQGAASKSGAASKGGAASGRPVGPAGTPAGVRTSVAPAPGEDGLVGVAA
jgi:hypothetical protein